MNHLLTILQTTLAQCLDLLAQGQGARSGLAEPASQSTGHWNSAQFLEVLPPESTTLLQRDEELYLAQGYLTDQKIRGYDK